MRKLLEIGVMLSESESMTPTFWMSSLSLEELISFATGSSTQTSFSSYFCRSWLSFRAALSLGVFLKVHQLCVALCSDHRPIPSKFKSAFIIVKVRISRLNYLIALLYTASKDLVSIPLNCRNLRKAPWNADNSMFLKNAPQVLRLPHPRLEEGFHKIAATQQHRLNCVLQDTSG